MTKNIQAPDDSSVQKLDIYDQEIAILTEYPERICEHWIQATPLFNKAGRADIHKTQDDKPIGCLTQIKQKKGMRYAYVAEIPSFTEEIYADDRIPSDAKDITFELLPVFADYQRRLDTELNRAVGEHFSYNNYQIYCDETNERYQD